MASPMKAVHNKEKSVPEEVQFMIQAVLVKLASITINENLRHFLKSVPENAEGLSWRITALHDFKVICHGGRQQ